MKNEPEAAGEAAIQFEALVIGMMLKAARQASVGEGVLDNSQTKQYLELMDQQVAIELARRGSLGFGAMIAGELGGAETKPSLDIEPARLPGIKMSIDIAGPGVPKPNTPEQFVERYLDEAKAAADELGVDPRLLLAQAALETGWGQSVPQYPDGRPAHNLFGIKAGSSWDGARVSTWTLEYTAGAAARKREQFRAYATTADSFADYVDLIRSNPRYEAAVAVAADAESYANALGEAGYATDPNYANKLLSIYRGGTLETLFARLK